MSAFLGMDPSKGLNAANLIQESGSEIVAAVDSVDSSASAAEWVGEDRDTFHREFAALIEEIRAFYTSIIDLCEELRTQAEAQLQASAGSGASGAGSAPKAPIPTYGAATAE